MDGLYLYTLCIAGACFIAFRALHMTLQLSQIPTVGGSSVPFLSYLSAVKSLRNNRHIIEEGYAKYKRGVFKFAQLYSWHVVVSDPKLIAELHKAPDDALSANLAIQDLVQPKYTLGRELREHSYTLSIIRSQFTRNLNASFSELRDELIAAFADNIPTRDGEWTKMDATKPVTRIVCRASNRLFVGLPLCRDSEYCDLNTRFTIEVFTKAFMINLVPEFLKPLVALFVSTVQQSIQQGIRHLEPVIVERRRIMEKGDLSERPSDLLQWMIEEAPNDELRTTRALAMRILTINMAAIHTSSITFGNALRFLATYPEYIEPLREEIEIVVREFGWSKDAMGKMHKVDSFVRESQRITGVTTTSMIRRAARDFTFSDGTFIPKGTTISTPMCGIHADDDLYPGGNEFQPFRFSDLRSQTKEQQSLVSTSIEWLPFGHGKHVCPGRFFAANEIKAMLAHLVMEYDVKTEEEAMLPLQTGAKIEVMFRKRQL